MTKARTLADNFAADINGITAGTGITGGGTSGTVTVTNSMATTIDVKGDLIAGTGADTFDRLAVGTNGQVLTADSTAGTGLAWATPASAGGMTLISTTTLSGASVTLSSIPSTYTNLQLFFKNMTNNTANGQLRIAPNGGTDYAYANTINNGVVGQYGPSYVRTMVDATRTSDANSLVVTFYNYALDDFIPFTLDGGVFQASSYVQQTASGYTYANSASGISSLVISNSGGTWSGGTVYLYGVK